LVRVKVPHPRVPQDVLIEQETASNSACIAAKHFVRSVSHDRGFTSTCVPRAFGQVWTLRSSTEYRDDRHGLFDPDHAATILGDCELCGGHLATIGLAAQLHNQFVNLCESRRANRVSLRFETARRVDRDAATYAGFATLARRATITARHQAEVFDLYDLADCGGVMHFGHADVCGADAGELISPSCGVDSAMLVWRRFGPVSTTPDDRRKHTHRA
jgi:hypothetical protein